MRSPSRWDRWDEEVAKGGDAGRALAALPDEAIVDLLRCADRQGRDYERDLLLVELGNRVHRLRRQVAQMRALAEDAVLAMERRGAMAERMLDAVPEETLPGARNVAQEAREHAQTLRRALDEAERQAFRTARERA